MGEACSVSAHFYRQAQPYISKSISSPAAFQVCKNVLGFYLFLFSFCLNEEFSLFSSLQDKLQSVDSAAGANSPYVVVQSFKALHMKYAKKREKSY